MQFQGKVALVTGGSEGIGAACIPALVLEGARVIAVARNESRLKEVVLSLPEHVRQLVTAVPADVRHEEEVRKAASLAIRIHGKIDMLLNCAGVSMREPLRVQDIDPKEWDRIVSTNLNGTFLFCREVLPYMKAENSGYIINILSTASFRSQKENSLYSASKFGVRALTESLIEENRRSGIRISSVSPGAVDTNIWSHKARTVTQEERATMLSTNDIVRIVMFLLTSPPSVHIDNITVTPWFR